MFYNHSELGKLTILVVYVDDVIITGSYENERIRLEKELMSILNMKNLGPMKYFLVIEVATLQMGFPYPSN